MILRKLQGIEKEINQSINTEQVDSKISSVW